MKPLHRTRSFLVRLTNTPEKARETIAYILGAIGWAIIAINYPFGWELPQYAAF